ncbi:N-acetyl-D-glucosamine kinase [Nymphaea thermarum]|nr:N-acetyl-D-glucosamine kinase [Nymphaea thermarum]
MACPGSVDACGEASNIDTSYSLKEMFPSHVNLLVRNDAIAALASGTMGDIHGCVLIAGTGTIAYGFSRDGREARAAGAGPLLGDRGRAGGFSSARRRCLTGASRRLIGVSCRRPSEAVPHRPASFCLAPLCPSPVVCITRRYSVARRPHCPSPLCLTLLCRSSSSSPVASSSPPHCRP